MVGVADSLTSVMTTTILSWIFFFFWLEDPPSFLLDSLLADSIVDSNLRTWIKLFNVICNISDASMIAEVNNTSL